MLFRLSLAADNVILALMAFNEQKTLISVGQLDTNSGYQR